MRQELNCEGQACPFPVINTKKAIQAAQEKGVAELLVIVDNDIAKENLKTFANFHDLPVEITEEGDNFHVLFTLGEGGGLKEAEDAVAEGTELASGRPTVVISSEHMGQGDDELGSILIKAFLFSLTQADPLPERILFYNSGVKLVCKGSPVLEDLKTLNKAGVEIWPCGTCINYYKLEDEVELGTITNMYGIVEALHSAPKLIKI